VRFQRLWLRIVRRCTFLSKLRRSGQNCLCKTRRNFSHRIALGICCPRLASIFDISEVELECSFSVFAGVLAGDVHFCRNLEKVGHTVYAKSDAIFFHRIALRLCCPRLASIFDIPEVELEYDFSLFGGDLSGDVHICRNLEKVGKTLCENATQCFSHSIALRLCCPRLASIFDIPEVELQCSFTMRRRVLGGDAYFR